MRIRPMEQGDLAELREIDGTIESSHYLHVERGGAGLGVSWRLEERALREKLIDANPVPDDLAFTLKQIVGGVEEGLALLAEHEGAPVGLLVAQVRAERGVLHVHDLRIDYDHRREGVGTALMFQTVNRARELELRAVEMVCDTRNLPGNKLLAKCGFELAGLDTHRRSNHDLVKEAVSLFWYATLD